MAAASVAGLGLIGCGMPVDGESRRDEENRVIPVVEAVQARFGSLPLEERVTGVVRARNQVAIQAEITAPVVEVFVRSGEAVQRGQPLVRLDDRTLRDQLRQAEANVRLAQASARESRARVAELQAQVVRSRALAAQELISDLELETQEAQLLAGEASADQADARVEQAEAIVQERQTALQRTLVRAPVSGRVGQRQAEVGMLVDSGSVLFLIGDLEDLMVEVPLTEEMLGYLRAGQQVRIRTDARSDAPIGAELSRISPFLEAGSFSTVGEIDVRNTEGRLSPGMFVAVDVLYGESEHATLVPTAAIWENPRSGLRGVWIVRSMPTVATPTGDAAQSDVRPVELRAIEVLAEGRLSVGLRGVEQDEWVVTVGQHLLRAEEGARVRAVTWDQVLGLQALQREDLLHRFLAKQQEVARETGAAPVVRPLYETKTSPPAPAQRVPESTF
ncbi:MAG TPA: efflux RND transporter periplasmic adaptor subunit [Thermoanaerobaculia bacterium]|nr:efflux RND transporter periplasmic adaptor subunit [Thermoanaerobaculia bacterium]